MKAREGYLARIRGRSLPRLLSIRNLMLFVALCSCVFVWIASSRAKLIMLQPTILLEDRHGSFLAEVGSKDRGFGYWPVEPTPRRVVAATIALEDRRFWNHMGVDPAAIFRAALQNVRSRKRISGASTLAMQIARMQNPGSRTYMNKAVEALTAVTLTQRYGREKVLSHYLSIVPYGNRIHGIAYAARRYLDKPVEDLSWAEICFLAAVPQAPGRMNPFDPEGMADAIQRGKRILNSLFAQQLLTREEYRLAMHQLIALRIPEPRKRPDFAMHAILHLEAMWCGRPVDEALRPHHFIFRTSLDLDLQREVSWMAFEAVKKWEKQGAGNAAVIVLDRNSNQVLAWVGSTGYFDKDHAGAIDYTQVARSSGSVLKPFIYGLALERGAITPATVLDDLHRGPDGIMNADDQFLGPLLPRFALANSRNVPAVELLNRAGLDETYSFLYQLGLHEGKNPARKYGAGLVIGGLPVTLEQLVRSYGVLARDGKYCDLVWFHDGGLQEPHRVLSEDTAREITLMLSDPMARLPAFPRMGNSEYPFPVAIKTGTSYAHRDAWTVAYSSRYIVGVWIGHPDYLPMNQLTGYRSAAALAQRVMLFLHSGQDDGLQNVSFPPPRGYHPIRICALTGKLATTECERVAVEWFRPGQEPVENCTAHFLLAIDRRTKSIATSQTPREYLGLKVFTDLGPRYAAWAATAGLAPLPVLNSLISDRAAHLQITLPENGLYLQRDPETPSGLTTIALEAVVDPPAKQVVWYVDGRPFQTVDFPYATRWPVQSGRHLFHVEIPFTRLVSSPVRVTIQ